MLIEAEARNFKNCSIKDVDILIPNFTAKNNGKRLKWLLKKVEYVFVCVHSSICHHQQGRIDFTTVNPSLSTGKDFRIHSL